MTALEAPTLTRDTQSPQWARAASTLWAAYGKMLVLWFWAIVLPCVSLAPLVISQFTEPAISGVALSHRGSLWASFGLAIAMVITYLPIHVANGMTRRSFAIAAVAVNVGIGLLNAIIATVALLIEETVYHNLGWFHGNPDGPGLEVLHAGPLTYGLGLALMFVASPISGCLVGICYYRTNPWLGTFLLPLTLLPVATVIFLGLDPTMQWLPSTPSAHRPWGAGASVLVLLAAIGALQWLVRGATVNPKKR